MFELTRQQQRTLSRIMNIDYFSQGLYQLWEQERLVNYNLVVGKIYDQIDLDKLIKEKRPNFQYPLLMPLIIQVAGAFKNSIPGIQLRPQTLKDEQQVDLFEKLNYYILYQKNDIAKELASAYIDAIIGRIGWIRQDYFYDSENADGNVRIRRADPFSIKFDTDTKNRNLKDCNWIIDFRFLSTEEIIAIYANDDSELANKIYESSRRVFGDSDSDKALLKTWAERALNNITTYQGEHRANNIEDSEATITKNFLNYKNGLLKVIDFYERRSVRTMTLTDMATGNQQDITDMIQLSEVMDLSERDWYDNDKLQQLKSTVSLPEINESIITKIYQTTTVPAINAVLYDDEQDIQNGNFRFTPIFCYDFHPDILEMKSMVDNVKDALKSFNQRRNTELTILQKTALGGWIAEEDALKEHLEDWKTNKEVGGIKLVKSGKLGSIKPIEGPNPQSLMALESYAQEDTTLIKSLSGIVDAQRGIAEQSGESGTLFQAKVAQSDIMQEWVSENAQATLKPITQNNIEFIQKYFTDYRVIRLDNDDSNSYQWQEINKDNINEILNDTSFGKFDVQISPVPYGQQAKETEFGKLVQMATLIGKINPALIPIELLIKSAPIVEKGAFLEYVQGVLNKQKQEQQMQQQALMAQQQAQSMPQQNQMSQQMPSSNTGDIQDLIQQIQQNQQQQINPDNSINTVNPVNPVNPANNINPIQ